MNMRSQHIHLERRQGYGAVTSGLSQAGDSLSNSASNATASLSRTQIIAVVVGIIVLAVLLIGLTWYCCVRTARKRAERREREAAQDSQRAAVMREPLHYGGTVTIGMPDMAATGTTPLAQSHSPFVSERRGSDPDDDYWHHKPLAHADAQPGAGYVVDFDELGNPRYHKGQQNVGHTTLPVQQRSRQPVQQRAPMHVRRY